MKRKFVVKSEILIRFKTSFDVPVDSSRISTYITPSSWSGAVFVLLLYKYNTRLIFYDLV